MTKELSEGQITYLELAGYIGVLNLVVTILAGEHLKEAVDPQQAYEKLEDAIKGVLVQTLLKDRYEDYYEEIWKHHSDVADSLLASIRSYLGLDDED